MPIKLVIAVFTLALVNSSGAHHEKVRDYFVNDGSAYWEALMVYFDIETYFTSGATSLRVFLATTSRIETCSHFLGLSLHTAADLLEDSFYQIQHCVTNPNIHLDQLDHHTIIDVVGKTICRWRNYSSDCVRQRPSGVYYPRNPYGDTCTGTPEIVFRALAAILHLMDCVKQI